MEIFGEVGAKMGPRWTQDGPSWQQVAPKMGHDGAKMAILTNSKLPFGNFENNSRRLFRCKAWKRQLLLAQKAMALGKPVNGAGGRRSVEDLGLSPKGVKEIFTSENSLEDYHLYFFVFSSPDGKVADVKKVGFPLLCRKVVEFLVFP